MTGVGAGTATIQATFGGLTGSVTVTVTQATLASIQVTPFNQTLPTGSTVNFIATGLLTDGTSINLTATASWTSSDPTVAAVSNAAATRGLTTTLAAGTVTITATSGGVSGTTMLTVTGATVTAIQVTPFNPRLPAGFAQQLVATAIFSDGTNRDVTASATWTSATPAAATVSDAAGSKGLVTGVAAGTSAISASFSGRTGSTTVTVIAGTLASLTIAPANSDGARRYDGRVHGDRHVQRRQHAGRDDVRHLDVQQHRDRRHQQRERIARSGDGVRGWHHHDSSATRSGHRHHNPDR